MSHLSRRVWLQRTSALALSSGFGSTMLPAADAPTPVKRPDPYAGAVFVDGEPPPPAKDSFTVVVLPDTQNYSEKFPEQYHAQTEWIVDQVKDRRIAAVLHLGDITNRSTEPEWEVASKAMAKLDGKVPYFMTCGNHDYSDKGACVDRTTRYNDYFPMARFAQQPNYGGIYDREPERMENCFHTFDAGGRRFVVILLEFGPRRDVVRWANEVAAKHADREAILVTHAYVYHDDTRYDWKKYGLKQAANPHAYPVARNTKDDVADGEELWNGLVAKHENFIFTVNGHIPGDGLGRLTTSTPGGRDVTQMVVNFQFKPRGGDGWLRLLEFKAGGNTIDIVDYSPTLNRQNHSSQNKFSLQTAKVG